MSRTSFATLRSSTVPSAFPRWSQERASCSESACTPSAGLAPQMLALQPRGGKKNPPIFVCLQRRSALLVLVVVLFPLLLLLDCVFLCRECLKGRIVNSNDAEVSCPEVCESILLDREIKAVSVRPKGREILKRKTKERERKELCVYIYVAFTLTSFSLRSLFLPHTSCSQRRSTSASWTCD